MNCIYRYLDRHPRVETALDYATAALIGVAFALCLFFGLSS